jgi:hypothetical protein
MVSDCQEDLEDWRDTILPHYGDVFQGLVRRYDESSVRYGRIYGRGTGEYKEVKIGGPFCIEREEHSKHGCRGGYNFASTLDITVERTKDTKAVKSIWKALYIIATYHPSAGSISWEMRRFIRRAKTEEITEFGDILREYAKINPDFMIDMDGLFWSTSYANASSGTTCQQVLNDIKKSIEMKKNPITYVEA